MDGSARTVGAWCAVLTTAAFVAGVALMASSGVEELIPGEDVLDWVRQVDGAGGPFYAGAWAVIAGPLLALVAFVGFYDALRSAGRFLVLAPVLSVLSITLVTISHLVPIAMAYRLVPGYLDGGSVAKSGLFVVLDTLASLSLVLNYTGNVVVWGVVVPLYAIATLKTRLLPRWIGWLGLFTALGAGWLGALSPASAVLDGISFLGFVAFFVWMAAMGVALLRRPGAEGRASPDASGVG